MTGKQRLGVNSTHQFRQWDRVAGPLRVVARSGDGVVEGLELKSESGGLAAVLGVGSISSGAPRGAQPGASGNFS